MRGIGRRARAALERQVGEVSVRELALVGGAMAAGLAAVVIYVLATRPHTLAGDEPEYHLQAVFFTQGKFWWSTTPFGIPHSSMWKAPAYPAWVGFWYEVLGTSPLRVHMVQALLAPLTVALTWMLARRLFEPRVALASAWLVAFFPLAFEYYGLLFPEALAVPLTVLVLLLTLNRDPTPKLALLVGVVLGISLLVRPNSFFLLAAIAVAWVIAAGLRRGAAMTALVLAVAVAVVAPWTIRNYVVTDGGFVPISVQDGAAYGTFNEDSANDPELPYAFRPNPNVHPPPFDLSKPIDDAEVRSRFQDAAFDYISDHPFSVVEALYWNGIRRFWDLRPPSESLNEVRFQSRSRAVRGLGLAIYYALLPLAVAALWRLRRRREIVLPVIALAVTASLTFIVVAATRYRAPLEPLIVILACSWLGSAARARDYTRLRWESPTAPSGTE